MKTDSHFAAIYANARNGGRVTASVAIARARRAFETLAEARAVYMAANPATCDAEAPGALPIDNAAGHKERADYVDAIVRTGGYGSGRVWGPSYREGGDGLRYVGRVMPDCGGRNGHWDSRGDCGHYTNPWGESFRDGSGLCFGVVYQLTGRDGRARFVAGFQFGGVDGGPSLDLSTVYESEGEESAMDGAQHSDASRAADDMAKRAAEAESDYQAAWRAGYDYAEAGEEVKRAREEARRILKERREAAALTPSLYPSLCGTIRGRVAALCEEIAEARAKRAELVVGDCDSAYFWPGDGILQSAFCEGAGLAQFPARL